MDVKIKCEVGEGIGIGNTCKPTAVSFQCMTKSTTKKNKNKNKNWDIIDIYIKKKERIVGSDINIKRL